MYRIESQSDADGPIKLLEDKIYEHNSEAIQHHDGHLFSKLVKDDKGEVVAGIAGWTWAGACEISQLWVNKKIRRNGIGKMLLDSAEQEAKSRGCVAVLIKTYSFQAPEFYTKNGYKLQHTLESFPRGHRYHTFIKSFGSPDIP